MSQHTDARNHDIFSYLRRPQILTEFEWAANAVKGAVLVKLRVPDMLLTPMYLAKLDGFTSFRGTAVFKLQLNSQPFQCGRLLMFAVPMPTLVAPRGDWIAKSVTLAQSLHNVQVDITKHSQVELRVPFVSPFNSYDLINGLYPWADVYIQVYSPLNQIEQSNLLGLVWAHFEDVELGAPTSGKAKVPKQQSGNVNPTTQVRTGTPAPRPPSNAAIEALRESERSGAIAKIGAGAQGAYDVIGKGFPGLKPVTDTLKTFSKAGTSFLGGILGGGVGLVSKLLGFSKTVLDHSGNTVVIRPAQYFQNVDGADHSHVMSLNVLNAVEEYPSLGGTDMAETSLTYLKKIPQFFNNFCYSTMNKYNDILSSWLVVPTYRVPATCIYMGNDDTTIDHMESFQPTVLNYISSSFAYWTGSLVYTLRFIKTDYHSGRIEIAYHPFVSEVDKTRMDYVYRLVVDLREKTEVSFVVPYISPQPWKAIDPSYDPLKPFEWSRVGGSCTGLITVRAITPLMCASAIVGKTIECVIECRGGDDYFVQCPTRSCYIPLTLFPDNLRVKQQSGGVYALPGTQETRTASIEGFLPPSITGMETDIKRDDTSMLCAGEIFLDFRSLIKRFCFTAKKKVDANHVSVTDCLDLMRAPFLSTETWQNTTDDTKKVNRYHLSSCPTPLNFVSSMYAFYRGGFRIKVYNPTAGDLISCQLLYKPDYGYPSKYGDNFALNRLNYIGPEAYEQANDKKFAEFQIPYYSPTIITVPFPIAQESTLYSQPLVTACISCTNFKEDQTYYLAAAAADDTSFHMFMGIPPVVYNTEFEKTSTNVGDSPSRFFYYDVSVDPTQFLTPPGTEEGWKRIKTAQKVKISDIVFDYYDQDCQRIT